MPALVLALLLAAPCFSAGKDALPVRGLHVMAPKPADMSDALKFIKEALPKEGVNVLVVEFNYRYKFTRRPEIVDADALGPAEVKALAEACRAAGVRLIPQINMLGHQSWSKNTLALLRSHPEFDETPGKYPGNEGIYCRSYCPLHPGVHEVLFDLMDELAELCEADAFHVGMDEVFLIGEDDCARCKGRNKAELFAQEVRTLRDHLAKSGRRMWIWGDRFLDGELTGLGKWEGSMNATAASLRQIPKDIVICDWHYEAASPTALYFALEGFPVISSPWRKPGVALAQLDLLRHVRRNAPEVVAARALGVLQTTWADFGSFVRAYFGDAAARRNIVESVLCFKELFREIRNAGLR
jgi:hypothetical protein